MPTRTPPEATIEVFAFKEGLLSAVAHDLRIRVTRLEVTVAEDRSAVEVKVDASSLRVACAQKQGQDSPGLLSESDKSKIETNIRKDVLESRLFPEIRFASTHLREADDQIHIEGTLALHGREKTIAVRVLRDEDAYCAEIRLHQPDFGIRPYRAVLGTLRVQPDVLVRVRVSEDRSVNGQEGR